MDLKKSSLLIRFTIAIRVFASPIPLITAHIIDAIFCPAQGKLVCEEMRGNN
jgi:hypothetical protein